MSGSTYHASLLEFRNTSIFTEERQSALIYLGDSLLSWRQSNVEAASFRKWLDEIDPFLFRRAVRELSDLVFHSYWRRGASDRMRIAKRAIRKNSDLAFLFCFDGNGFVREHAVKTIVGPLQNPFEVIAVLDACNNWVPEIRAQAFKTAMQSLPKTSARVMARAYPFLRVSASHWKRWQEEEHDEIIRFFTTDDVISCLAEDIINGKVRSPSKTLGFALEHSGIDQYLPRLFNKAKYVSARAQALNAMLNKKAVWKIGYKFEWIDKSLGIRRRVPVFSSRSVRCSVDFAPLVDIALRDKHTAVRRIAAQAIIDNRSEIEKPISEYVKLLLADECSAIRSRGEYLQKHLN